ncbi:kinase-like protein [Anopheles sinensis]|uniref:Kinase-like protein n=1 Tax=Anopheles sinensis TaxID=74873 RepID=A0A084WMY5_ANOSI|nr:kinase-like protein [Anopheles sinensis]
MSLVHQGLPLVQNCRSSGAVPSGTPKEAATGGLSVRHSDCPNAPLRCPEALQNSSEPKLAKLGAAEVKGRVTNEKVSSLSGVRYGDTIRWLTINRTGIAVANTCRPPSTSSIWSPDDHAAGRGS